MAEQDSGPLNAKTDDDVLTLNLAEDDGTPPPGGPAVQQLSVTSGGPEYRLKPYQRDKQHDWVRMVVTVGLLAMLGWVVVWASVESASWPGHWSQTKEMLQTILPALTGLIGSVIGFYFGSGVNTNNPKNNNRGSESS